MVSGVGNMYADEALWAARVHYGRPTSGLAPRTVRAVLDAGTAVMLQALAEGGTSFDDMYVDVNGESGYFERSLNAYGRAGRLVPTLRHAHPARPFHEPFFLLLSKVPTASPRGSTGLTAARSGRAVRVAAVAVGLLGQVTENGLGRGVGIHVFLQ